MSESVRVIARCRPFNQRELDGKYESVLDIDEERGSITIKNLQTPSESKTFTFDAAFAPDSKQIDLYNITARPIVDAALNGFNGTIFCYGQTGTGKTFTMVGDRSDADLKGIIPNAIDHIFDYIAQAGNAAKFLVRASYLEIYNEDIRDLLQANTQKLELKEKTDSGVYVKDLSSFVVKNATEMDKLMSEGNKNRSVAFTQMNATSSRSHSIFTVTIEVATPSEDGDEHIRVGKLNLVDLAGSERQSKTGATGDRLKEATKINLSLSALGNVISALVDGKSSHIPYRDSKLTRLLQDSLGGNAKTMMVATLSPASFNFDENVSTLRYANRAKNIKNKPKINEDPKDAMLREYQEQINKLKEALEAKKVGRPIGKMQATSENFESDLLNSQVIHKIQADIEVERQRLIASKDMAMEEKQRAIAALETRAQELETERKAKEELSQKLAALESKLLIGGENLESTYLAQKEELERQQRIIQKQRETERELQERIEKNLEAQFQLEENNASLQEQVELKTKKLQKLVNKIKSTKSDIIDIQDEFRQERQDLLDAIREISRELLLKETIIAHFIPPEEKNKVESRAFYNEEKEDWTLKPIEEQLQEELPMLTRSFTKRAISAFALEAIRSGKEGSRYRIENVISIPLDMPERTTRDYDIAQSVRSLLGSNDEDLAKDLVIDAPNAYLTADFSDLRGSRRSSALPKSKARSARPKSAMRRTKERLDADDEVPVSRNSLAPKARYA